MGYETEIRKYIDDYKEYLRASYKKEVIVSYDCSNKDNPFRKHLMDLLKSKSAIPLNESLYKLPPLNEDELLELATEVTNLLEKILIKEAANVTETKVIFITPNGSELNAETIISHKA